MRVHADGSLHGLRRNPWNFACITAGNSGGEGAAIASERSPLGLGIDVGGSLRNPASACDLASLRPSMGRVRDATQPPFENRPIAWLWMAVHGFNASSEDAIAGAVMMKRPVVPANLLGLRSACVPAAPDPQTGLPIGAARPLPPRRSVSGRGRGGRAYPRGADAHQLGVVAVRACVSSTSRSHQAPGMSPVGIRARMNWVRRAARCRETQGHP